MRRHPGNVNSLGLTLVFDDGPCHVKEIQAGGLADLENSRLRSVNFTSEQLQVHDQVIFVNGTSDSRGMAKELHTASLMTMCVWRPAQTSSTRPPETSPEPAEALLTGAPQQHHQVAPPRAAPQPYAPVAPAAVPTPGGGWPAHAPTMPTAVPTPPPTTATYLPATPASGPVAAGVGPAPPTFAPPARREDLGSRGHDPWGCDPDPWSQAVAPPAPAPQAGPPPGHQREADVLPRAPAAAPGAAPAHATYIPQAMHTAPPTPATTTGLPAMPAGLAPAQEVHPKAGVGRGIEFARLLPAPPNAAPAPPPPPPGAPPPSAGAPPPPCPRPPPLTASAPARPDVAPDQVAAGPDPGARAAHAGPAAATAAAAVGGGPAAGAPLPTERLDAGGCFQVRADYAVHLEPQNGYLPLSKDELVNVRPSTRMRGDAGNRYPEYVFGRRVRTPNDEGWLPTDIIAGIID